MLISRCHPFPRALTLILLGVSALLFGSCGSQESSHSSAKPESTTSASPESETINFGVYTADKASKVVEQFAPTIAELEKTVSAKLGRPIRIRLRVSDKYETGIEDLTSGKVQFSRLGPASFITAKQLNPDLRLLVMESKKGERASAGIIAVHRDSPITSLADIRGKNFAFGDPLSTIGRYLSQSELLGVGLNSSDLASFQYLGRHDIVGMAVAAGDYDAGALKESTFDTLVEAGQPLRELARFPNVTKPWVAHPSLKPDIAEALRSTFIELRGSSVSKDGFLSAEEHYYQPIRDAMASVQAF